MQNTFALQGSISGKPETFEYGDGKLGVRFNLVVPRGKGGTSDTVPLSAFGAAVETVRALKDGDGVMASGRIGGRTWTTQSGEPRHDAKLVADLVASSGQGMR